MKEFKEIIAGIAHSLNMTVDGLVKAYPHLRTEYSWYYFCDNVQLIFSIILVLYAIISVIFILVSHFKAIDDDYDKKSIELLFLAYKVAFLGVATLIGIILVAIAVKSFTSPDVLIIDRVLDTINQGG